MDQKPSVGRIVNYVLPSGAAGGNSVGQIRPMIITQVWPMGQVNGKVILDGINDLGHDDHAYTKMHVEPAEGEGIRPGTWHWPARV